MHVRMCVCLSYTVLVRSLFALPPSLPPSLPVTFRHGIALLLTYKCGSLRMPESQLYRVPLRWLGVRPLQILQRFDLPDDVFQDFSEGDARKCRSLLASPFCQAHPRWKEEVEAMVRFSRVCVCVLFGFDESRGHRCSYNVAPLASPPSHAHTNTGRRAHEMRARGA